MKPPISSPHGGPNRTPKSKRSLKKGIYFFLALAIALFAVYFGF